MKTTTARPLPANLTKVSYITEKKNKSRLEKAAKRLDCSMSEVINRALDLLFAGGKTA